MPTCPSDNQQTVDQTDFWTDGGIDWDAHRIGWAIAGACAAAAFLQHCRSYTNPAEQRQILRILYMPPIYGVISFLSYRFFRSYTYYELVEVGAMLLIEFVASSGSGHKAESSIARKDKRNLPFPPYFMYTLKWAVLQYVIFRPAISIAAIICQAYNVLCESEGFNAQYANVYLEAVDFVSISVALYGLFLFYGLTKEELVGRRPLAKFLAIKLIVMFTWYQSFVFDALEGRVIHATQYWTETNIADGLNALAICIEMIFFACFMWWAYTPAAYRIEGAKPTSIWRPLWDSCDFALEIWSSSRFFISYIRGIPETRSRYAHQVTGFDEAFGLEKSGRAAEYDSSRAPRMSYDEDIRLAPYRYGDARDDHDASTPVDHYVSDGSHPRF
ncbi:organic solute transporter Ostalpha-domain-containing protein [Lentinula boryana]|uniref:Organic solute transporter Ostalpha-domain-containing protein n=1 Tax=Lentinula boryana TaxID=40481 RepID=A0ABQ8Q9P0_9AGAR|nr:organic solute transporter Ostalpha-domain-containing protein [Lentinula boryana]